MRYDGADDTQPEIDQKESTGTEARDTRAFLGKTLEKNDQIKSMTLYQRTSSCLYVVLFGVLSGYTSDLPADVPEASPQLSGRVDFNFDVRPILSDRCYQCHGPDENARKAALRLDTAEGALTTVLESGRAPIVPGLPDSSALIERIFHPDPEERMPPPDSKLLLSSSEKATLLKWIEQGAVWKPHWAFIAPARPDLPAIRDRKWPRNEIDQFVLARLERERLKPSSEARRETLIRRVTLDLTGLPPTLEEIDAFLQDDARGAYERVVDRLLASRAYGERWAWDWLDVARYADTSGFQADPIRTMWPWRDWVVDTINDNMPFDRFTVEQLAGDLLPDATQDQVLATGFNRNHMYNGEGGRVPEETRVENVFDRVETLGTAWLGLTVNCSRCHDHKFDPLTQKEYYQFYDYFNQTSETGGGFANGKIPPVLDLAPPDFAEKVEQLKKEVGLVADRVHDVEQELFPRPEGQSAADSPRAKALPRKGVLKKHPKSRSIGSLEFLTEEIREAEPAYGALLDQLIAAKQAHHRETQSEENVLVMVMDQREEPRETFVLTRGTYDKPTEEHASANVPAFLPPLPDGAPGNRHGLAAWLVSRDNPLTARVIVNRYWQALFGNGFVKTTEDFGIQGDKPSHPRLLDWLAVEFVDSGWDVKRLLKSIVMSTTYRQTSAISPELLDRDPENRLLARGSRSRLPSWMIRDQALAVSGLLIDSLGGPPVKPYQPEGIWKEATFGHIKYEQDHGEGLYRRTLYTFWRRIVGPTMLFDNSPRQTCSVKSTLTNTPLHALTTLNDITYVEAARVMAERMLKAKSTDEARLQTAFRLATARHPSKSEETILRRRLSVLRGQFARDPASARRLVATGEAPVDESLDPVEHAAMAGLCSLILNLDEAISKQ